MGIYDVPAGLLIEEIAGDLKARIPKPGFADFVKTGAHNERAPQRPDWFHVRMASVLYRAYKTGKVGTNRLRAYYGGRRNRGLKPEKKKKASGKIVRLCLQLLEKEGLLKKEKFGRSISPKGEKYLYAKALEAKKIFDEAGRKKLESMEEEMARRQAGKEKTVREREEAREAAQKARQLASSSENSRKGESHGGRRAEAKKA